jgi:sulfatase maturation enzyme AslB (radical SAM superfamily)
MCVINHPTPRKKGVMAQDLFLKIVESLCPYKERIEMFDFIGLGEPFLDPFIIDRIKHVKNKGFRNLAISTNAQLLDKKNQKELLDTGIETVLFSIDGVNKRTHEDIRRGVCFETVTDNVQNIIKLRDANGYKTRFIVRFIRQESNQNEWGDYQLLWGGKLSKDKGDFIAAYDMHTWGGEIGKKSDILRKARRTFSKNDEETPCHHIFDKMIILADGSMPLCSEDLLRAGFSFGNANNTSALDIYNSEKFNKIRKIHIAGRKNSIMPCRECSIFVSEAGRSKV